MVDTTTTTFTANRRNRLKTGGRGSTITIPKIIRQGKGKGKGGPLVVNKPPYNQKPPAIDPEVVKGGKFFNNDQLKKQQKELDDLRSQAKGKSSGFGKGTRTTSANLGKLRDTAKFQRRSASLSRGFGGNRGKRAILGKIVKAAIKNPGKTGLLGAGILATNYLLTQRRDRKIRAANQRVLNSPNTPKLSIADTTFNPSGKSKKFIVGKK